MGGTGVSKSQVSRLCEEIDGKVKAFLDRPIEGDWPYLWIDATYVKQRDNGRNVSAAVIVAVGVNGDWRREALGMDIDPSEAETFWTAFLRKLARRGLRGVKLVISDAHEGVKAAVAKVTNASWQRCRVHFMRNVLVFGPVMTGEGAARHGRPRGLPDASACAMAVAWLGGASLSPIWRESSFSRGWRWSSFSWGLSPSTPWRRRSRR